jgi:transcriptional regulator with XRE-family HTH domain
MEGTSSTTPLGAYIRKAREAAGLTLRQLAEAAGIDHGYLAHIEAGERAKPGADVLQRLADALELDDTKLLGFIGVKPSLPEPRVYFRRKYGVNAREADVLARLIEEYQTKQQKGGRHEDTNH